MPNDDTTRLEDVARLARAEKMPGDGPMVARLNENGSLVVTKEPDRVSAITGKIRHAQSAQAHRVMDGLGFNVEKLEQAELERRADALIGLLQDRQLWEREQIVKTIEFYAEDCDALANAEADPMTASAQRIRASILRDVAEKIDEGWRRNPETGEAVK